LYSSHCNAVKINIFFFFKNLINVIGAVGRIVRSCIIILHRAIISRFGISIPQALFKKKEPEVTPVSDRRCNRKTSSEGPASSKSKVRLRQLRTLRQLVHPQTTGNTQEHQVSGLSIPSDSLSFQKKNNNNSINSKYRNFFCKKKKKIHFSLIDR
jgi:hypothetical protein